MTRLDLVKRFFPKATREEANSILWSKTPYPFGVVKYVYQSLARYKRISGYGYPTCEWCNDFCRGNCCPTCSAVVRGGPDE